jgi:hypothetical protein
MRRCRTGRIMKKKIGIGLCLLGGLFLINAILGRYIVLPGYMQTLEAGASGSELPQDVPVIKVLRYLLWAYSFKLGVYFFILGTMIFSGQKRKDKLLFSVIGIVYIGFAYMELPFNSSLFFGIGGGILTLLFLYLFFKINIRSTGKLKSDRTLYLNLGFYFLAMAAYSLCPFLGIKCFALQPEKMIAYGLETQAASFANHIMIELVLGFIGICAYYFTMKEEKSSP